MPLNQFKTQYQALQTDLSTRFLQNPNNTNALVLYRSQKIDQILTDIWHYFKMPTSLALCAVGGYGRAQLHFHSDIDLLILIPEKSHAQYQKNVANFLAFLWDIGLEVGASVRDLNDCTEVMNDLSVTTNLLESRLILGEPLLFSQMQNEIKNDNWASGTFFIEKQKEQTARYKKFSNTASALEPNLKESPGGLRDIQTIVWLFRWYFDTRELKHISQNFLSKSELKTLTQAQNFLWKVRFALHIVAKRCEDRLLFSYQKQLAQLLGYTDKNTLAVEQFMKDYYQSVSRVSRLNDILLQLLAAQILNTQTLNTRFFIKNGLIQIQNPNIFQTHPSALIEIFFLISKHHARAIEANTLRKMISCLSLMDKNYHKNPNNNRLFIKILQQTHGVNLAIKLMNRYGVLERYIPQFSKIIGLMQFDLFHTFTVDQHTLFVVRNLRRFFIPEFSQEFPLASQIAQSIKKPELLFLAGLFHDIAKGRGGNHAELGALDAHQFCIQHQLKSQDTHLVATLVKNHLLMSQVAQKQDIDDLSVIQNFAHTIKSITTLKFLYLLSVADTRATRADLWNDFKDALFKRLYHNTLSFLQNQSLTNINQTAQQTQKSLTQKAHTHGIPSQVLTNLFANMPLDYFTQYETSDILWHLQFHTLDFVIKSRTSQQALTDIFIKSQDSAGLFVKIIHALELLNLEIINAKILTSKNHKAYNTISILPNSTLSSTEIEQAITQSINNPICVQKVANKRTHQHFQQDLRINFSINQKWHLTQVDINALDKQALLSNIAFVFFEQGLTLVNAQINTLGERVEDTFYISANNHQPLNTQQQKNLKTALENLI
jgi:[protein-PII] uridylyltransferase